jgi:hypothetical protein
MAFDFKKFIIDQKLNTKVELNEMARVAAVAFKLAPDYESKLINVKIGSAHKAMIEYLKSHDNEPTTIGDISRAIGKDSASINQPYFRESLVNVIFEPVPIGSASTRPNVKDENDVFVEPQDVHTGKKLAHIIDAEDMILGGEIEDDLENGVLSYGPESKDDDEKEPSSHHLKKQEPTTVTPAKKKAVDFALDNERLIKSIINNYSSVKSKIKEAKSEDVGGISSKDIKISDTKSKETATSKLPELIAKLIEKIKAEEPEVQKAILDNLSYKFTSIGYTNLYKKIAKEMGETETDKELKEAINILAKQLMYDK